MATSLWGEQKEEEHRTIEEKLLDIQKEATEALDKATKALEYLKENPEIQMMKDLGVI